VCSEGYGFARLRRYQRAQRGSSEILLSRGSIDNGDAESEDVVAVLGSAYVLKCERGSNGQGSAVARFRSWAHEVEFTARQVQSRAFAWARRSYGIVSCEGAKFQGCVAAKATRHDAVTGPACPVPMWLRQVP
jgi:hypothetical protein